MDILITVFTPTFNRGYILQNLYNSLLNQNYSNFEWLIVDDGSTDNTKELIETYLSEGKLNIVYLKQTNHGKHFAINNGVKNANGYLFFIVDSDDYLLNTSLYEISEYWEKLEHKDTFCGLTGLRVYSNYNVIGGNVDYQTLNTSILDYRYKHGYKGDKAEIFKTSVLKEFPFPETPHEKFCPEALVWNRISHKYLMHFFNKPIYICEYLNDGLSAKVTKILSQSPLNSTLYYKELVDCKIPLLFRIKAAINYWRYSFWSEKSFGYFFIGLKHYFFSLFCLPIGFLFYLNDKYKIR
jgi:glycosyltransferase involved in cell wall biosynthesis